MIKLPLNAPKAPQFHHSLNQPPRSARQNGKYRRAGAPAHGHSFIGADYGARGSTTITLVRPGLTAISHAELFSEPKSPTVPYAGIRTGEIIGHRLWWVIDGLLCSLAHKYFWSPGQTIYGDTTKPVDHFYPVWRRRPVFGGTYAFASMNPLAAEIIDIQIEIENLSERQKDRFAFFYLTWQPLFETSVFVAGTVKMWGNVIEHEKGYRAEFAKVNSLDRIFGADEALLITLRERYLHNKVNEGSAATASPDRE